MRISEILLSIAAFVVIVAGMKATAVIVVPFILSAFIAIDCAPLMFWLQKKGAPAILTVLLIVSKGIVMAALDGQSVNDFSRDLPLYKEKIKAQTQAVAMWLAHSGIDPGRLQLNEIFDPAGGHEPGGSHTQRIGQCIGQRLSDSDDRYFTDNRFKAPCVFPAEAG